jgi:ATP-dependent protease Clp ATPase subunit
MNGAHRENVCSFCGRQADKVQRLVVSEHAAICDYCVAATYEALREEGLDLTKYRRGNPPDPEGGI